MSPAFRCLAVLSLLGTSLTAQEQRNPWYATFGGGYHSASDSDGPAGSTLSYEGGYSLNLGVGRNLFDWDGGRLGIQGEVLFNSFEIDKADVSANSLSSGHAQNFSFMFSGVADLYLSPQFGVYGGVGIGYSAQIEFEGLDQPGTYTLEDDTAIALQARAGFKYGLGGGYDVGLGYRYFRMDSIEISSLSSQSFDLELDQHIFEVVLHWGL